LGPAAERHEQGAGERQAGLDTMVAAAKLLGFTTVD